MPDNQTVSPISVLGMGQCGSKIAFALSLEIDPLKPFAPQLAGVASLKLSILFERVFSSKSSKGVTAYFARNDFYIGDMNAQNDYYVQGLKLAAFKKALTTQPHLTYDDFARNPPKDLIFEEEDKKLFERVKRDPAFASNVEVLSFRRNDEGAYYRDGAGGLQFISEYLASTDAALYPTIAKRQDGTLIGIFSAGGGTGAGSVFSLLSRYKAETHRYTLGLCILPGATESEAPKRAGRFLTRYLSKSLPERFDTLLLFSNLGALTVAGARKAELSAAGITAIGAVNEYLTRFVYYYSMINQPTTNAALAKVFDPADARTQLSQPCFIGFGVDRASDFDPERLFLSGFGPAEIYEGTMAGIGASFGEEASDYRRVGELLAQVFKQQDSELRSIAVDDLNSSTFFYQTIKKLYVFYFLKDEKFSNDVVAFQGRLKQCITAITGGKVELSVCAYESSQVRENSVMILCFGGLALEIVDNFLNFVHLCFFPDDDDAYEIFREEFFRLLRSCNNQLSANNRKVKRQEMRDLIEKHVMHDFEWLTDGEAGAIAANPVFKKAFESKEFDPFRIGKKDLLEAGVAMVELATRPRAEQGAAQGMRAGGG